MTFGSALLTEGSNAIRIDHRFIAIPDRYYLDWIELDYPRLTVMRNDRLTMSSTGGEERYAVTGLVGASDPLVLDVTDPFAATLLAETTVGGAGPFTIGFQELVAPGRRYHLVGDGVTRDRLPGAKLGQELSRGDPLGQSESLLLGGEERRG